MDNIVFYTQAYNAEKTLGMAIESILGQTFGDFVYYIFDDGSVDGTKDVILEYAKRDSRIVAELRDMNHKLTPEKTQYFITHLKSLLRSDDRGGYWAICDADDEYKPDFLEKMLAFIKENELDVAACGFDFIDVKTGTMLGDWQVKGDLLLGGGGFSDHFPQYHNILRTMTGKLFSLSTLRKCSFANVKELMNGSDTVFTTEAFSHAERAGVLAGTLYKYYYYPSSVSTAFYDKRIASDRMLDDIARDFLIGKSGEVNSRNDAFLNKVYFDHIENTMGILFKTKMPDAEKIAGLHDIFTSGHTARLIAGEALGEQKHLLFDKVAQWLLLSGHFAQIGAAVQVVEILAAMGPQAAFLSDVSPMLSDLSPKAASFMRHAIAAVLLGDMDAALDEVMRIAGIEIPDDCSEHYLLFAQNICAAAEYAEGWIIFQKEYANFLIETGRTNEALEKIKELEELLPDDEEVRAFRKRTASE